MLVVTKLDRLARSLPGARDIADELTARQVKLNIGGSVHDPTDPVGRLLFNVLAMIAEFEADLIPDEDPRGNEDRQGEGATPGQATEAQLPPGGPPGRSSPRRGTHHHRAGRALLCVPVHGLPCHRASRTRSRPGTIDVTTTNGATIVGRAPGHELSGACRQALSFWCRSTCASACL
jgi:hypothetical protein